MEPLELGPFSLLLSTCPFPNCSNALMGFCFIILFILAVHAAHLKPGFKHVARVTGDPPPPLPKGLCLLSEYTLDILFSPFLSPCLYIHISNSLYYLLL